MDAIIQNAGGPSQASLKHRGARAPTIFLCMHDAHARHIVHADEKCNDNCN
jgi:hypothetical protein